MHAWAAHMVQAQQTICSAHSLQGHMVNAHCLCRHEYIQPGRQTSGHRYNRLQTLNVYTGHTYRHGNRRLKHMTTIGHAQLLPAYAPNVPEQVQCTVYTTADVRACWWHYGYKATRLRTLLVRLIPACAPDMRGAGHGTHVLHS